MEVFIKTTIIFFFITYSRCMRSKLEEVFSWKIIDFDFPSIEKREIAIKNKSFIPENNQLMGLEVWKNKLFVSLPPWRTGLAATLAFIDLDQIEGKSPKLKPYPNWETHDLRNSTKGNKLANVIRLNVDHCGRLWVADRGIINIMGSRDRIHSPKIQIFDAETDEVLKVYNIPDDMINDYSFFGSIVADVSTSDCAKAYAYVSDLRANALFVYSLEQDDMWRVEHHFFHFEPLSGNYIVGDVNFQWTDGIIGISLSPEQADGYKILYFCPMSSTRLFAVSTRIIQNNTIDWSSWNNTDIYYQFEVIGNRGAFMQSTTSTIDSESGIMFYTLLCQDTIACWNPKNEYSINGQGVIARDKKTLSYPNDVKVDKNGILWVLSNRLHQFVFTGQNFSDINFRIFRVPVHEAIRGTVCEKN